MSIYDPSLEPDRYIPGVTYGHSSPRPIHRPEMPLEMHTKRGSTWEFLGEELSLWSDPPIDARWVQRIQEVDPYLVPIWIKLAFKAPDGHVEVFTRHGLASYMPKGSCDYALKEMPLPASPVPWKILAKPNVVRSIFRDPEEEDVHPEIPVKPYVTFTGAVYQEVKHAYDTYREAATAEKDVEQWRRDQADRERLIMEKAGAEADYRFDHDNRNVDWFSMLRDMPARELNEHIAAASAPPARNPMTTVGGA